MILQEGDISSTGVTVHHEARISYAGNRTNHPFTTATGFRATQLLQKVQAVCMPCHGPMHMHCDPHIRTYRHSMYSLWTWSRRRQWRERWWWRHWWQWWGAQALFVNVGPYRFAIPCISICACGCEHFRCLLNSMQQQAACIYKVGVSVLQPALDHCMGAVAAGCSPGSDCVAAKVDEPGNWDAAGASGISCSCWYAKADGS